MQKFNLEEIKTMVLVGMNDGPSEEITADFPHDKGWTEIGGDFWYDGDFAFCGPSGGDSTRTKVSGYNPPCCPVCNGLIQPFSTDIGNYCKCSLFAVRAEYGLETEGGDNPHDEPPIEDRLDSRHWNFIDRAGIGTDREMGLPEGSAAKIAYYCVRCSISAGAYLEDAESIIEKALSAE